MTRVGSQRHKEKKVMKSKIFLFLFFQNYNVVVIGRLQWLISTDTIASTKLVFILKFGFGRGCSPAAHLPPLGCANR